MKRDDLLFHKFGPGLLCLVLFWIADVIGFFKLLLWHFPMLRLCKTRTLRRWSLCRGKNTYRKWQYRGRRSGAYVYRYSKAKDQLACTAVFGGLSDETISNSAGRRWRATGFGSPAWVIWIKWLTDRLDGPGHIEKSIEPVRDDGF